MQNTISMALVSGQVLANIEVKWGQKVKLGGSIMIKGVKEGNTSVSESIVGYQYKSLL